VTGKSCRPISTSENGVIPFRARSQAFADLLPLLFGSAAHGVSREINEEHSETPLYFRIGLSAGEPIEEHGDLFGKAVQLAARLCAHAVDAGVKPWRMRERAIKMIALPPFWGGLPAERTKIVREIAENTK
jgi:hypothetical protein